MRKSIIKTFSQLAFRIDKVSLRSIIICLRGGLPATQFTLSTKNESRGYFRRRASMRNQFSSTFRYPYVGLFTLSFQQVSCQPSNHLLFNKNLNYRVHKSIHMTEISYIVMQSYHASWKATSLLTSEELNEYFLVMNINWFNIKWLISQCVEVGSGRIVLVRIRL